MAREPKYRLVEKTVHEMIENGTLKVGDQIPTEEELCERFGFSRMTVSKALNNLSVGGYIERVPGRGSFVARRHVNKSVAGGASFTEDMAAIGMRAGARLISYVVVPASDAPVAPEKLRLSGGDLIHHFVRLRTGDGAPVAISDTYISAAVIPAISVECLSGSFYEYVHSLGISTSHADMELSALLPTEEQKRLLEADDIALLCSSHVTYTTIDGDSVPYEYINTYYNGNVYTYHHTM